MILEVIHFDLELTLPSFYKEGSKILVTLYCCRAFLHKDIFSLPLDLINYAHVSLGASF